MAQTLLAQGLRRALRMSAFRNMSELCSYVGARYNVIIGYLSERQEPQWLRQLREERAATGVTWDELLRRSRPDEHRGLTELRRIRRATGVTWDELLGG